MKITALGTGNAFSELLGNTSFLIEKGKVKLLIDCGFTVPPILEKSLDLKELTHIFISHIHSDHVGGLEKLAYKLYFKNSNHKPHLLLGIDMLPTLWTNYLGSGLRNSVTPDGEKDLILNISSYFNVHPLPTLKWFEIGESLHLAAYQTKHVGNKLNYSLIIHDAETNKNVLFTCDVIWGNKLPYTSSDLIFHDCSFSPYYPATVHTHVSQLLTLPTEIQEKIICTHYEDFVLAQRPILDVDISPLRIASPMETWSI